MKRFTEGTAKALCVLISATMCATVFPQASLKAQAAGTGKDLQLGATVLNDNVNTTSAPVVYYDSKKNTWKVVGYGGTGVASPAGTITLISSFSIYQGRYSSQTQYSNNYSGSNLQTAMDLFTERLTTGENGAVALKTLTGGNPNYGVSGHNENDISGPTVSDAVMWPLSVAEANQLNRDFWNFRGNDWWLRSPGRGDDYAACVGIGFLNPSGKDVTSNRFDMRAAFNLNLSSIIFTSAAEGGKSSGSVGAGALTEPSAYDGNSGWKLTVLDSSRSFTASRADSASVPSGDTIVIDYTGATVGSNEFVSAILLDSSGNLLYYGKIQSKFSGNADDSALVTIPDGLTDGTYTLKIFSEQCNGDKLTDLASAFSSINITVDASAPRTYTLPVPASVPISISVADGEAENEESQVSTKKDWLEIVDDAIDEAIKKGEAQIYLWGVTGLPITTMRKLKDNPQITLVLNYTYENVEYNVTIPGKNVVVDDTIPWYGPLYLNKYYS